MALELTPQEKLSNFRRSAVALDDPNAQVVAEMRKNRAVNRRLGSGPRSSGSAANISFASMRPRDPMFYWEQNNLPYDYRKEGELEKIRAYARMIYITHPVIASAIDVYSKYPLTGMELTCKDDALTEFYSTLFFDELNYEDYLIDIGREYWTVGEAWPLGSFNESLGVWEADELINPDDVDVIKSPFLREPRFEMKLPQTLRDVITTGQPRWEYEALMRSYPELRNFLSEESRMPVSSILLKQLRFKADPFFDRGLPILMRGFRAVLQEEMLNAAQDAIASRLYTPLILAKLGASATDLGTNTPWVPTDGDIEEFEAALDAALAGDFRVLTHHFATSMDTVFGRESMPNMNNDFDRLTDRQLQVFGLSKTMLSGAQAGETYAADAINRDLISQLLTTYQRMLQKFFRDRALVVAEAQEHFDYEERGGKRYVVMEEILEVDEETGKQRIVEQPKLLVPELRFKAMTMKDEQDQRQFIEALRQSGVPISMKTRLENTSIDLEDEIQRVRDEQVQQVVEAEETRKATFIALRSANLPIPDDLKADYEPRAMQTQDRAKAEEAPLETIGLTEPGDTMALAPTPEDLAEADLENGQPQEGGVVVTLPRNRIMDKNRPPESDEQRATMPKPASIYRLRTVEAVKSQDDEGNEVTTYRDRWHEVDPSSPDTVVAVLGEDREWADEGPNRLISGPSHVGMRRYLRIDKDTPLDDDEPEPA